MRKNFVTGLITLLPLVITLWIIKIVVNAITSPFINFVSDMLDDTPLFTSGISFISKAELIDIVSTILIVLSIFLLIVTIGYIARWVTVSSAILLGDELLRKIPFFRKIYSACKDFTDTMFSPKAESFNQVVLVPYPTAADRTIGIITSKLACPALSDEKDSEFISVLIPGTPTPTIGYVLLFDKRDVQYLDIPVKDAMKYIISAGSSIPEKPIKIHPPVI